MTMSNENEVASRLLDFTQQPQAYVSYLDSVIDAFYSSTNSAQQAQARAAVEALQAHPDAWGRVDVILQHSKSPQSKFVALQILEEAVKAKWNILPEEQRAGIRRVLSDLIIAVATSNEAGKNRVYLHKLNVVLVQVLKKDWPSRWPNFIEELVGASKTSENLCENSMHIFKLLSEEVFDFNRGELTQAKTRMLKTQLNVEFGRIHELCHFVLSSVDLWTTRPNLIKATLAALQVYLTWIPLAYIFNTNLLDILLGLFPRPEFRNLALQCLTEVGSLPEVGTDHNDKFVLLFQHFMNALVTILPQDIDVALAYENGTEEDEKFVQNLALFLTTFLKEHLPLIEGNAELKPALVSSFSYLVRISYVQDPEVFKVGLDYWNRFVPDIYTSLQQHSLQVGKLYTGSGMNARVLLYDGILKELRRLMVERMVKPEEVLITADEHGNVVRDVVKDTDLQQQYKTMRETLVYLSHLDHADTEMQMLDKLRMQLDGEEWQWDRLNTLCWAIGSISGSMDEQQENQFLVTVIRDLLNLCEKTRGKDNKAVIASNIMYVVGQYPRFLRAHWKFLKTVVNKLFEFMHELHPGVQMSAFLSEMPTYSVRATAVSKEDMAVETLLKICHKCKRKFAVLQPMEQQPFVAELLVSLSDVIKDLKVHQVNMFYESVALMIRAEGHQPTRDSYLVKVMELPNQNWHAVMAQVAQSADTLERAEVQHSLHNLLQANVSVCQSMGGYFMPQMVLLFAPMLQVYAQYSQLINNGIQQAGPLGAQHSAIKSMRSVKKVTLQLIETFVETSELQDHLAVISADFVPALMTPILSDYEHSLPDARESEVLSMFAMIVNKLKGEMVQYVPKIFASTFECTLNMIKGNYVDFPEHRLQFFSLLAAITNNCFSCLRTMLPAQQGLLIDSIVWAFRHTERNVADTGLSLLSDLLMRYVQERDLLGQFLQQHYCRLVQEIFAVMTDTMHKPGFRLQVKILSTLLNFVKANTVPVPLWGEGQNFSSNAEFIRSHLLQLLASSFPNMTEAQVQLAVDKMFEHVDDHQAFKNHCRDFLVQTKEFGSADNSDLYADEKAAQEAARRAAVPGLVNPNEVKDEQVMDD